MENEDSRFTIVVNSCDNYSDLWNLFFLFMERYWPDAKQCPLILNSETKTYHREGWTIQSFPAKKSEPYGLRMHRNLKHVSTPYTLMLLDDFFLRSPADTEKIKKVIHYLDQNPNAVCFNFCPTDQKGHLSKSYPEFYFLDQISEYKLNMQAAIWRTDYLISVWPIFADPWDWEYQVNKRTYFTRREFYYKRPDTPPILNYGRRSGQTWGVVQGKWYKDDIVPFFEKEGVSVDYSKRGWFEETAVSLENKLPFYKRIVPFLFELYFGGFQYSCIRIIYVMKKIFFSLQEPFVEYLPKKVHLNIDQYK